MQNSYSFLVNLETPGFNAKFKIGDGTHWEVTEYWTFLENPHSDIVVDNLGHVVVIKQKNHRDRAYDKKFEAYPLEQTQFSTIEKNLNDSCYWFSTTYREYDEAFRPNGKGAFHKILCKLTFERLSQSTDVQQEGTIARRGSKKRYNYSSLQNISSTKVKSITMKTVIGYLLEAIEKDNHEMKDQAIEFIVRNFKELKSSTMWQDFSRSHRELKEKILDIIIEHMGNQTERANTVLHKTVSQWNIAE